jgi:TolB-like protein
MINLKKHVCLTLILFIGCSQGILLIPDKPQKTHVSLAVLTFQVTGERTAQFMGRLAADRLTELLLENKKTRLIERRLVQAIEYKYGLGAGQPVYPETLQQAGRALGVRYAVLGKVQSWSNDRRVSRKGSTRVKTSIRVVDLIGGEVLTIHSTSVKSSDSMDQLIDRSLEYLVNRLKFDISKSETTQKPNGSDTAN